jgi:hypothetical protein
MLFRLPCAARPRSLRSAATAAVVAVALASVAVGSVAVGSSAARGDPGGTTERPCSTLFGHLLFAERHGPDHPLDIAGEGGALDIMTIGKHELYRVVLHEPGPVRDALETGLSRFNEQRLGYGLSPIGLVEYAAKVDGPIASAAAARAFDQRRAGAPVYTPNQIRAFMRRNVRRGCDMINASERGDDVRAVARAGGGWLY